MVPGAVYSHEDTPNNPVDAAKTGKTPLPRGNRKPHVCFSSHMPRHHVRSINTFAIPQKSQNHLLGSSEANLSLSLWNKGLPADLWS